MNNLHIFARLASALMSVIITAGIAMVFEFGHLA
jgi:hypothetical protein